MGAARLHLRQVDCEAAQCSAHSEGIGDFIALHTLVREGDDLEAFLLQSIASAHQEILVAVQELSLPKVAAALVEKRRQGVTVKVVLDLMTAKFMASYATKPIYFFGRFAFGSFALTAACFAWTLINRFAWHVYVKDQPLFLVGIFFAIAGCQFVLTGLLAELQMRTYYESQGKPTYFVRERLNLPAPERSP